MATGSGGIEVWQAQGHCAAAAIPSLSGAPAIQRPSGRAHLPLDSQGLHLPTFIAIRLINLPFTRQKALQSAKMLLDSR
jgi:hypothetical protein